MISVCQYARLSGRLTHLDNHLFGVCAMFDCSYLVDIVRKRCYGMILFTVEARHARVLESLVEQR